MSDNDFFKLLEPGQTGNSNVADEIVFRDETGALKVLRNGEVADLDTPVNAKSVIAPVADTTDATSAALRKTVAVPSVSALAVLPENLSNELDMAIDEAIKRTGVTLTDEQLVKRFRNIVQSRLKGIRNRVQVYETLIGQPSEGGIGLDEQTADRVGVVLNEAYTSYHSHEGIRSSKEQFDNLQSEAQKILSETAVEKPLRVYSPTLAVAQKPEIQKDPIIEPPQPRSVAQPVLEKPMRAKPTPAKPMTVPGTPPPSTTFETTGKQKIEDVRYQARLTGPVEEIHTMTLTDFRRLAPTPELAKEKILEKIELLEDESFTRRVEGIRAWKENEISRLYIALGHQSMEERKSIADIIAERQRANLPTLSEAEVEAVIELNKKLRY